MFTKWVAPVRREEPCGRLIDTPVAEHREQSPQVGIERRQCGGETAVQQLPRRQVIDIKPPRCGIVPCGDWIPLYGDWFGFVFFILVIGGELVRFTFLDFNTRCRLLFFK